MEPERPTENLTADTAAEDESTELSVFPEQIKRRQVQVPQKDAFFFLKHGLLMKFGRRDGRMELFLEEKSKASDVGLTYRGVEWEQGLSRQKKDVTATKGFTWSSGRLCLIGSAIACSCHHLPC